MGQIRELGAEVRVVTFAEPEALDDFQEYLGLSFPLLSDESRVAYRTYGLEEGSFWQIWHPKVVLAYLKYAFQGKKIRPPRRGDDLDQLGGDFVIDSQGLLRYAHRSVRPDDRPESEVLLAALREAAQGTTSPVVRTSEAGPTGPELLASRKAPAPHESIQAEPDGLEDQTGRVLATLPQGRPFLSFLFSFLSSQVPLGQRLRRFFSLAWRRTRLARRANPTRCRSFWKWWAGVTGIGLVWLLSSSGLTSSLKWTHWAVWAVWLLAVTLWAWLHLGLVHEETDSGAGAVRSRFGMANALSFGRLALAPLAWIALITEGDGWPAAVLIAALAASDLADGSAARGLRQISRFGRIADPMADVALMTWLGLGMFQVRLLPVGLGVALLLRYPGLFLFVFFWTFAVRPLDIRADWFGKATTALTATWLVTWSGIHLVAREALGRTWLKPTAWILTVLIFLNLLTLVQRLVGQSRSKR